MIQTILDLTSNVVFDKSITRESFIQDYEKKRRLPSTCSIFFNCQSGVIKELLVCGSE